MINRLDIVASRYTNPDKQKIIPKIPATKNTNEMYLNIVKHFIVKNNNTKLIKDKRKSP
jgi:hypothetical protein